MKRSLLAFAAIAISTQASADVINMKNGDVYRAQIVKEEFEKFVQILLKDGSEKRLQWKDIDSLERGNEQNNRVIAEASPAPVSQQASPTAQEHYYPSQMLNDTDKLRFELDLIAFAYDSTWQKASFQINNAGTPTSSDANATNHYLRTVPSELSLAVYMGRWHAYFNYLNSAVNSNDIEDQQFASFAFAYAPSRNFDIGLVFDFNYDSTSLNSTTSGSSGNSSSYAFGPQMRFVALVDDNFTIETTLGAGLNFRNMTVNSSSISISGSDTAFSGIARIAASVNLYKGLSYVGWVDGWITLGTLDGTIYTGGKTYPGSLQLNTYRLRVAPLGLRIKF